MDLQKWYEQNTKNLTFDDIAIRAGIPTLISAAIMVFLLKFPWYATTPLAAMVLITSIIARQITRY